MSFDIEGAIGVFNKVTKMIDNSRKIFKYLQTSDEIKWIYLIGDDNIYKTHSDSETHTYYTIESIDSSRSRRRRIRSCVYGI